MAQKHLNTIIIILIQTGFRSTRTEQGTYSFENTSEVSV